MSLVGQFFDTVFGWAMPGPAPSPALPSRPMVVSNQPSKPPALTVDQARLIAEHSAWVHQPRTVPDGHYDHPGDVMHGWPLQRRETGLLEAACEHGVGHPIPESVEWMEAFGPEGARTTWGIHGCDGCCHAGPTEGASCS